MLLVVGLLRSLAKIGARLIEIILIGTRWPLVVGVGDIGGRCSRDEWPLRNWRLNELLSPRCLLLGTQFVLWLLVLLLLLFVLRLVNTLRWRTHRPLLWWWVIGNTSDLKSIEVQFSLIVAAAGGR